MGSVRLSPTLHEKFGRSRKSVDVAGTRNCESSMAHDPIDTLGKATRHNMLVRVKHLRGEEDLRHASLQDFWEDIQDN